MQFEAVTSIFQFQVLPHKELTILVQFHHQVHDLIHSSMCEYELLHSFQFHVIFEVSSLIHLLQSHDEPQPLLALIPQPLNSIHHNLYNVQPILNFPFHIVDRKMMFLF